MKLSSDCVFKFAKQENTLTSEIIEIAAKKKGKKKEETRRELIIFFYVTDP